MKGEKGQMPKDSAGIWFSRSDSLILFVVKKIVVERFGWPIEFDDKADSNQNPKRENVFEKKSRNHQNWKKNGALSCF